VTEAVAVTETILIVDDEEPVRKTFREWLEGARLDCRIIVAADAETALVHANQDAIDLAILDWNLGAGNDGLQLLEDLYVFNPDVVAVMITGFAHQATPLDAMRMGVRDYLDKNQDLNRSTFLAAIQKQLERIRPAKRERQLHRSLVAFREALDKVLPLVQSAAALNDPVPLPEAIGSLFRFLLRTTAARDGVLIARSYDSQRVPAEVVQVWNAGGEPATVDLVPFSRSLAASVVSMEEPCAMVRLDQSPGSFELQPFEQGRQSLLAAAMPVGPGTQVVIELFDKQSAAGSVAFSDADRALMSAAADFGAEMLRHALSQRQTHRLLFDAIGAALGASDSLADTLKGISTQRRDDPPPAAVMDRLRQTLTQAPAAPVDAEDTLRLVEAVRVLAVRHGQAAVQHCIRLIESLRHLLDNVAGTGSKDGR
jgi:ActR/RegA family two-component response regulator